MAASITMKGAALEPGTRWRCSARNLGRRDNRHARPTVRCRSGRPVPHEYRQRRCVRGPNHPPSQLETQAVASAGHCQVEAAAGSDDDQPRALHFRKGATTRISSARPLDRILKRILNSHFRILDCAMRRPCTCAPYRVTIGFGEPVTVAPSAVSVRKLRALLAGVAPPALPPIRLSIGEPQHATPIADSPARS